ncbi:SCO family protein [Mangrovicella endophytica]|uniref:SCO family protein n=1 Tax=Mangrovicella endophytica TaxID=2066697 RepID=UPI0018E44986|nr:SCO family protein [Mangrovicella endophytica]
MSAVRVALWAIVALMLGAAIALFAVGRTSNTGGGEGAPYGSGFSLVDQNDQPVTEAVLRDGTPAAVFFGFTHCPEVCPTTLFELAGHQKALKDEGKVLQVVFVSVDPERDTPAVMKDYVSAVSPDIKALTGSPEAVSTMAKGWGVYARKVPQGDSYTMDHTATVFLIDGEGKLAGTIAYGENPDTARQKLERLTS